MAYDLDLDRLALETGISSDRLSKNLATYGAMSTLFPMLEVSGCEVGLFGGTALNKIYFGKKQRLSYDLDIFARNADKALNALEKAGAKRKYSGIMPANLKTPSIRLEYGGIIIDLVEAKKGGEEPAKRQAYDLLFYYGRLVPPVVVPSYSLEYLLAEKTVALLDRNELKDIYDTWIGIQLLKDAKKYLIYLKAVAKERKIKDIAAYADFHITDMLKNTEYYEGRRIETLSKAGPTLMLKGIRTFIDTTI